MRKRATVGKARNANEFQWIVEGLEGLPAFHQMKMMGCELISVEGKYRLVLADKVEPWKGLLVCTSKDHHHSLFIDLPALRPHPVLGKWLYLSPAVPDFEGVAELIVSLVRNGDPR
ncbi:MAG: hypothetical protein AB7P49_12905, partial [Bdellovibrionales bacterium]